MMKSLNLSKQETLKKLKKKPKTEEEEAKEIEEINTKVIECMSQALV